jgi:aminoglycoside 3-N-acetyltransferase
MYIPYQQIADNLGLKEDDTLLIASDISKLAYNTFKNKEKLNSNLLVDSFKRVLKDGTLLFPAFIDDFKSGDTFDKLKNTPEMGALSKLTFERVDFIRSNDPLHSFMVFGVDADDIAEIESASTFGHDSVFAYLKNKKAKMLLIDVDLEHSFTFAHFVEEDQQVSYRKYSELNYKCVNENGEIEDKILKVYVKKKGVVNTLNKLEPILIEKGAMGKIEINESIFRLIHLDTAFDIIKEEIILNKAQNLYSFNVNQFVKSIVKSIIN